jgi:glycosyltransferase involved in cell wall biosynthesis
VNRPLRVLALARTGLRGPSTRYRIAQYRGELAQLGVEVELAPLFDEGWFRILEARPAPWRALLKAGYSLARLGARVAQARRAHRGGHDLVLIEQQLFPYLPWALERLLWPRSTPVLLEFDDAIWLTFAHRRKLAAACARADTVLAGNAFLADFARRGARRVAVIPTTIDLSRYPPAPPPPAAGRPLRLGWIGLRYNLAYLSPLAGPLRRLAAQGVALELRVISSAAPAGPEWQGLPVVHRPWSEAGEVAEMQACDAGLMPLPDDDWARGKCGLKLLQFMAAGRPVVASPVGVNSELVRDGENGLLAAGEAGWEDALRRLAADPDLRARLGAAGRRTVESGYSLSGWAGRLAETYRLAASR